MATNNKIALVTGGSRGLGKNMALSLAQKGINVILTYNSKKDEGLAVVAEIEKLGQKAATLQLNTGDVKRNNNDHVISFDGKQLAVSSSDKSGASIGWVLPITGGEPKRMNEIGPSYMHGWSPDGQYLVFTGQRDKEFDIYRIPSAGGPEVRLTTAPGLDDGPEYSPDGKYIYFNSVRSGLMQIWRMKADGSEQTQLTNDD